VAQLLGCRRRSAGNGNKKGADDFTVFGRYVIGGSSDLLMVGDQAGGALVKRRGGQLYQD
jgi:hypothetical protein